MLGSVTKGRPARSMLAALVILVFTTIGVAAAATTADTERKLNADSDMLDKSAGLPQGEKAVVDRLAKTFNLPADRIAALRDKSLGYGEIAVTLTIAEKMAGGLTNENINKVVVLRQGHKGWGEIARSVNVKLPAVANRVDSIERNAQRDVRKAAAEKSNSGKGAGGSRRANGR